MDVRPVGAGPAGPVPARAARIPATTPPSGAPDRTGIALPLADSAAALIQELPASDLAKITRIIEPLPAPEIATHLNGLLEAAASAAAQGHVTQAIEFLAEFAQMDPQRAQALPSNPRLQPVRTEIEQLLGRLAALAKLDATGRLAHAAEVADGWGTRKLPEWETGPEPLLAIANRLFESGTHAGYSHAAELAQSILDATRWAPAGMPVPAASLRNAVDLTEDEVSGPVPTVFR
ncbi:MAG TPA: hypothetical protein VJ732_09615, partial [Bryobacteraceae bacterium]|nr:hypothetical protein [Bryobacteraceae bacterium]